MENGNDRLQVIIIEDGLGSKIRRFSIPRKLLLVCAISFLVFSVILKKE